MSVDSRVSSIVRRIFDFPVSQAVVDQATEAYQHSPNTLTRANLTLIATAVDVMYPNDSDQSLRDEAAEALIRFMPNLPIPVRVAIPDVAELRTLLEPLLALPMSISGPEKFAAKDLIRSLIVEGTRRTLPGIRSPLHTVNTRTWLLSNSGGPHPVESNTAIALSADADPATVLDVANGLVVTSPISGQDPYAILLHPRLTRDQLQDLLRKFDNKPQLLGVIAGNPKLLETTADEVGRRIGCTALDSRTLGLGNFSAGFLDSVARELVATDTERAVRCLQQLVTNPKCSADTLRALLANPSPGLFTVKAQILADPRIDEKRASETLTTLMKTSTATPNEVTTDAVLLIAGRGDIDKQLAIDAYEFGCRTRTPAQVLEVLHTADALEHHIKTHGAAALVPGLSDNVLDVLHARGLLTAVDWDALAVNRDTAIWAASRSPSKTQSVEHGSMPTLRAMTAAMKARDVVQDLRVLNWAHPGTARWQERTITPIAGLGPSFVSHGTVTVLRSQGAVETLPGELKTVVGRAIGGHPDTFAAEIKTYNEGTFVGVWRIVNGRAQDIDLFDDAGREVKRFGPELSGSLASARDNWRSGKAIERSTQRRGLHTEL